MDNVKLEWEKFDDIKEIGKNDDTEFYAFTQNNTLLYIGIAYFQDVADEIRKQLELLIMMKMKLKFSWVILL